MRRSSASNPAVAALVGLDYTSVSRLRSGDRKPTLPLMVKVRDLFDWSLDQQAEAVAKDRWHDDFEDCLIDKYGLATPDVHAPA